MPVWKCTSNAIARDARLPLEGAELLSADDEEVGFEVRRDLQNLCCGGADLLMHVTFASCVPHESA